MMEVTEVWVETEVDDNNEHNHLRISVMDSNREKHLVGRIFLPHNGSLVSYCFPARRRKAV